MVPAVKVPFHVVQPTFDVTYVVLEGVEIGDDPPVRRLEIGLCPLKVGLCPTQFPIDGLVRIHANLPPEANLFQERDSLDDL
jgi:hypothetical protein